MGKKIGKACLFIVILVAAVLIGSSIGTQFFKARYFKSLDDFEFIVVKENPVCPLHERAPSNFPIIVNTNEGSAAELRLYDTYHTYPLQIREDAEYGVMWMLGGKGWNGAAYPDNNYAHFSIQRDRMFKYNAEAARLFFCDECLKALRSLDPSCNFVVVDAYEMDNLKFYDIADVENTQIRHYSFIIEDKGYDLLTMEMHSSYFEGGKELDYLNKEDTSEMDKFYEEEIPGIIQP